MPYDMANFTLKDMAVCSSWLRKAGKAAASMEEAANSIVAYLRNQFVIENSAAKALALVRFFITHDYRKLSNDLRAFARHRLVEEPEGKGFKCLVLLATAGEKAEWNSVRHSVGHKAIPLVSEVMLEQVPMISELIKQFGITAETVLSPGPSPVLDMTQKSYNVFYIHEARGNPYIPAQDDFVIPFGIRSVLGFGGLLPSGSLFAVILFSKVFIAHETANLFRTLALSVKVAVLPFDGGCVFGQDRQSEEDA